MATTQTLSGTFAFEGTSYEYHAVKGSSDAAPNEIEIYRSEGGADREWVGRVRFAPTREVIARRADDHTLLERMASELETARFKFRPRPSSHRPAHGGRAM